MKKIAIVVVLLAAGIAILPSPLAADCRARSNVKVVVREQVVIVNPIAIATFVPIVVAVPQYSVGPALAYSVPAGPVSPFPQGQGNGPGQMPAAANSNQPGYVSPETHALREEIVKLRGELAKLRGEASQGVPGESRKDAPAPVNPALKSAAAKCAACHGLTADRDGGGKVFCAAADFKPVGQIAPALQVKILTKSNLGMMPPGDNTRNVAPLTDQEASAIQEYFSK